MTLASMLALFLSMLLLAAIPGPGILVVVSRTLSGGFSSGASATFGILLGDYVFITLAFLGLSALASSFYELFQLIKYLGAAYLIYLGVHIILSRKESSALPNKTDIASHSVNVLAGLITTLSNPKAIFFYVSFFPAFLGSTPRVVDLMMIYLIATLAIGSVMLIYAFVASKGKHISKEGIYGKVIRYFSGFTLVGCGALVAVKV